MSNSNVEITGLYKNLLAQIESIYNHSNELSFKTRARYFGATKRFCKFLADNFRPQNFKNVEDRHFISYVEYLKENNAAAYSGIGKNTMRNLCNAEDCDFVLWIAAKRLIKRQKLDEYLANHTRIER